MQPQGELGADGVEDVALLPEGSAEQARDVAPYGEIWGDMGRYGGDIGRYSFQKERRSRRETSPPIGLGLGLG